MGLFFLSALNKSGIGPRAIYLLRTSKVSAEIPCEQDRGGITLLEWVSVRTGPVRDASRDRGSSEIDYVANSGSLQTRPRIALVRGDF
jgi:hypothetical protein